MTTFCSGATSGYLLRATLLMFAFLICGTVWSQNKIDSLKNEISISTPDTRASLAIDLSFEYISINIDSANRYAGKALTWAVENDDKHTLVRAYTQRGRIALITASFEEALEYFLKAEELSLRLEPVNNEELVRIYSNLGAIYERQQELPKSLDYAERAIRILDKDQKEKQAKTTSPLYAPLYNNIANTLIKLGDTAKAIVYQKKGLSYARAAHDYERTASLLNNLGKLLVEKKQFPAAYLYLHEGRLVRARIHDDRGLASSYRNLALYFRNTGRPDSTKYYIRQSNAVLSRVGGLVDILSGNYALLSDAYEAEGKYDSALEAFRTHQAYRDSMYSGPKFKELARVEARYEMMRKTAEEQARQEAREFKTIIVISALVSGVIILVLLFAIQKFRIKNQRLLFEQLRLREEKLVSEQNSLKTELEYKSKDLATQMLFLLKKDEIIHRIVQRLTAAKKEFPVESQSRIVKIIRELTGILGRNDSAWQEFELRFKEVHQQFYENLETCCPDLTPKERRLCALLKLNMTTKEIAAITNQSTRSLEVARTRLRKKFNLTNSEIGLVDFLAKL